ncbi:MAG: murein L,D-transpeptidase family protein [Blastocatellia bacterium]
MKRMLVSALVPLAAAAAVVITQGWGEPVSPACPDEAYERRAGEGRLNELALKLHLTAPRIVIRKGARELTLYDGARAVRVYRVGLGFDPEGDKARQGDGRTPEGSFYVCVKNSKSRYYLSLGLSYPSERHAARGLRDGLITRAQHDQIIRALGSKARPPWDTPLGGEIFIHGHGSKSDWTFGCVALEDGDMKELFDATPEGTQVVVEP